MNRSQGPGEHLHTQLKGAFEDTEIGQLQRELGLFQNESKASTLKRWFPYIHMSIEKEYI